MKRWILLGILLLCIWISGKHERENCFKEIETGNEPLSPACEKVLNKLVEDGYNQNEHPQPEDSCYWVLNGSCMVEGR